MKKYFIQHINNTYNYGSMMMAQNLINKLLEINAMEIELYVDCNTDSDLSRLKAATGYEKIFFNEIKPCTKFKKNIFQKVKNQFDRNRYNKKISKFYDKIFVIGGDDFSEYYLKGFTGKLFCLYELKLLKTLNKRNNVFLIGQTIGPYTGIRKKYASHVFNEVNLYTRDDVNYEYMKTELGVECNKSRDLAFLDLHFQTEQQKIATKELKKYYLEKDNYVVIVGTGLMDLYTDKKVFVDKFCQLIFAVNKLYPNKKIVWLSHVTTPKPFSSDNIMLEEILSLYPNLKDILTIISIPILPVNARIILGNSHLVITCRMHAAVSSYQMGVPAIVLSYSPKFKGVISDGLGMEKLVIEASNKELWNKEIISDVMNLINYIEDNRNQICKIIKHNVCICQKIIENTLLSIEKE